MQQSCFVFSNLFYFFVQQVLISYYFIRISVYMSIPIAQFIPPPPPPPPLYPLGVHTFVLYICVSILDATVLRQNSFFLRGSSGFVL